MKTFSLCLLTLFVSVTTQSQDFAYNGPAQSEVRSFWIKAMGIQKTGKFAEGVAILETKLKAVKEKDPSYKTDKMEAEIARWKSKDGSTPNKAPAQDDFSNLSPTRKALKADELLRKLFDEVNIDVSPGTLPVIEIRFKEYSDKAQQYITLNTKPKENDIKRIKTIIEKHVYATNQDITNIENSKKSNVADKDAAINYYLAKYNQLYWDAAVKLFPEESSFADEFKRITDLVNKNGSLEDMKAGMNKNNAEKIKTRKLPAPVAKDVKLEKIITDGFNKKYGASQNVSALKAVLTQNGWTTLRNSVTGVVIGRERSAKIAYKGSDGKCYLLPDYVFIHEEYSGSSFSNTTAVFNGLDGSEMLCENVK